MTPEPLTAAQPTGRRLRAAARRASFSAASNCGRVTLLANPVCITRVRDSAAQARAKVGSIVVAFSK